VLVYAGLLVAGGVLGDRRARKGTVVTGVTFVAGLHDAIWVAGVAYLVAAPLAARLAPRRHPRRGA
jgi:hypothetical protein